MRDDELMDQLLKNVMAADAPPQLPPTFEARVMQRVRPRRLTPLGRVAIALYVVVATIVAAWFMRDLPMVAIVGALAITVPVAAGASAYGRRLMATG